MTMVREWSYRWTATKALLQHKFSTLLDMAKAHNDIILPIGPFSALRTKEDRAQAKKDDHLVPFFLSVSDIGKEGPIGFVPVDVLSALLKDDESMEERSCWLFEKEDGYVWAVSFADWVNESEDPVACRTEQLDRLGTAWKAAEMFPDRVLCMSCCSKHNLS